MTILVLVILRFFFRTEIIIVKKFDRRVELKDVLKFKKECEEMVTWYKKPLILGILSTDGFSDEAIEAVKYKKGKVHERQLYLCRLPFILLLKELIKTITCLSFLRLVSWSSL